MTDAFTDQLRHGRDVFDADDAKVGTVAQEAPGYLRSTGGRVLLVPRRRHRLGLLGALKSEPRRGLRVGRVAGAAPAHQLPSRTSTLISDRVRSTPIPSRSGLRDSR
jgi:hypothetical protein